MEFGDLFQKKKCLSMFHEKIPIPKNYAVKFRIRLQLDHLVIIERGRYFENLGY